MVSWDGRIPGAANGFPSAERRQERQPADEHAPASVLLDDLSKPATVEKPAPLG